MEDLWYYKHLIRHKITGHSEANNFFYGQCQNIIPICKKVLGRMWRKFIEKDVANWWGRLNWKNLLKNKDNYGVGCESEYTQKGVQNIYFFTVYGCVVHIYS